VIGTQTALKNQGLVSAWDIEDFVRVGRKKRVSQRKRNSNCNMMASCLKLE